MTRIVEEILSIRGSLPSFEAISGPSFELEATHGSADSERATATESLGESRTHGLTFLTYQKKKKEKKLLLFL